MAKRINTRPGKFSKNDPLSSLRLRASEGDIEAMTDLGLYYETGIKDVDGKWILTPSRQEAAKLLEEAATNGSIDAMLSIANILDTNKSTKSDRDKALMWLKKAARLGSGAAAYNIGITYRDVGKYRLSVTWFQKAIDMSEHSALLELAYAEMYGLGLKRDVKNAFRKLQKLTRLSGVLTSEKEEACILAARLLLEGWLVPRSIEKARQWLKRAENTSSTQARAILEDLQEWEDVSVKPADLSKD